MKNRLIIANEQKEDSGGGGGGGDFFNSIYEQVFSYRVGQGVFGVSGISLFDAMNARGNAADLGFLCANDLT